MDALTKLKMLSSKLEDPEFVEQFSRDFDKFLSERSTTNSMQSDFSEININFLKDNYKTVKLNFLKDNYEIDMDEDGNLYQFILPFYSSLSMHFEGAECENIKIADIGFSLIDEKVLVSIADKIIQKTVDKA